MRAVLPERPRLRALAAPRLLRPIHCGGRSDDRERAAHWHQRCCRHAREQRPDLGFERDLEPRSIDIERRGEPPGNVRRPVHQPLALGPDELEESLLGRPLVDRVRPRAAQFQLPLGDLDLFVPRLQVDQGLRPRAVTRGGEGYYARLRAGIAPRATVVGAAGAPLPQFAGRRRLVAPLRKGGGLVDAPGGWL
jgi:hypothetical protein